MSSRDDTIHAFVFLTSALLENLEQQREIARASRGTVWEELAMAEARQAQAESMLHALISRTKIRHAKELARELLTKKEGDTDGE